MPPLETDTFLEPVCHEDIDRLRAFADREYRRFEDRPSVDAEGGEDRHIRVAASLADIVEHYVTRHTAPNLSATDMIAPGVEVNEDQADVLERARSLSARFIKKYRQSLLEDTEA